MGPSLGLALVNDLGQRNHLHLLPVEGHPGPSEHYSILYARLQPGQFGLPGKATCRHQKWLEGNPTQHGGRVSVRMDEHSSVGNPVKANGTPWGVEGDPSTGGDGFRPKLPGDLVP